jgi:uncharacterized ferritin-like protein (DUF455 family)
MELREFAERVLMGTCLEEKLRLNPSDVTDDNPGDAIALPSLPGRPEGLVMASKNVRGNFPSLKQLEDDEQRGRVLHFLANHELLATELMALVLLRFPNAPKEFRLGVFKTLKEEQAHTLMYMRRMKECGIEFGSVPLNDYFWKMVSPMEQPIDFVTRLSLTFEQANLDYSKHYAKLFQIVGDSSTAKVLEKIYSDEIEHVGHGLKWFKKWKQDGHSDWQAYKHQLSFPLVPSKAKGMAPFNREGRIAAGLDSEFIDKLELIEGSRGRTPIVHLFNPNAEGYAQAQASGRPYSPKKAELALEHDLEMLPMAWARRDDVVLVHQTPSLQHLAYLRRAKMQLPEWVNYSESLADRKLGGMEPWAWTSDAIGKLKKYVSIVSPKTIAPFRDDLGVELFSKDCGRILLAKIQPEEVCKRFDSFEQVRQFAATRAGDILMKAPFSSAGRGHRKYLTSEGWIEPVQRWVERVIDSQGFVIAEPYLNRVLDFSAQYQMNSEGQVKLRGMTRVINDAGGRFLGCMVHQKWISGADEKMTQWLFRDAQVMQIYRYDLPRLLEKSLGRFSPLSAFGVDAFVYLDSENRFRLRSVVELNMRFTMGRVALDLLQKNGPIAGYYEILRKSKLAKPIEQILQELNHGIEEVSMEEGSIVLNDPALAQEFYAVWHARKTVSEIEQIAFNQ